jgi:hypothetical protein
MALPSVSTTYCIPNSDIQKYTTSGSSVPHIYSGLRESAIAILGSNASVDGNPGYQGAVMAFYGLITGVMSGAGDSDITNLFNTGINNYTSTPENFTLYEAGLVRRFNCSVSGSYTSGNTGVREINSSGFTGLNVEVSGAGGDVIPDNSTVFFHADMPNIYLFVATSGTGYSFC